jgi:hypothetical protein
MTQDERTAHEMRIAEHEQFVRDHAERQLAKIQRQKAESDAEDAKLKEKLLERAAEAKRSKRD